MALLIRFLIFTLAIVLALRSLYRFIASIVEGATGRSPSTARPRQVEGHMVKDPICGTYVVEGRALPGMRGRETAWFCSTKCQQAWLEMRAVR